MRKKEVRALIQRFRIDLRKISDKLECGDRLEIYIKVLDDIWKEELELIE